MMGVSDMISDSNKYFEKIAINKTPLIDVRSPSEFKKGAFINAVNLPLMNEEERHLVGACYTEKGSEEAIRLGHQLVKGEKKQNRIEAWSTYIKNYPESMIYCFRGGLRSRIAQEWIFEATGKKIQKIEGGYKAFRNYLIQAFDSHMQKSIPMVLGGYTGSGKTKILNKLENSIDMERIANHRGSSFGRYITPQPTQINFENNLAYALLQHKAKQYTYMILEDESNNIGRCLIPKPFFRYLIAGQLVLIDIPFEERVVNTYIEYVIQSQIDYVKVYGKNSGFCEWYRYICDSITRLKKRLGGAGFKCIMNAFEEASQEQRNTGDTGSHKRWIALLLKYYYDPMYAYQIEKNAERIIFRGNGQEVYEYLKSLQ